MRMLAQTSTPKIRTIDPAASLASRISANSLVEPGSKPFYLQLTLQVMALDGHPAEQGVLDYWWAGPESSYVTLTSPSIGTVHNFSSDGASSLEGQRAIALAQMLLEDATRLGRGLDLFKGKVSSSERNTDSIKLSCLETGRSAAGEPPATPTAVCSDDTGTIRLLSDDSRQVIRNGNASFAGKRIAMTTEIHLVNRLVVKGRVEVLRSFDPQQGSPQLEGTDAVNYGQVGSNGMTVQAPKLLHMVDPMYPTAAESKGIAGTVALLVELSQTGIVQTLIPLASPDSSLTLAAVDAVKKWTFSPRRQNGAPTASQIFLDVDFTPKSTR